MLWWDRGGQLLFPLLFILLSNATFGSDSSVKISPLNVGVQISRNGSLPSLQLLVGQNVSLRCESRQPAKLKWSYPKEFEKRITVERHTQSSILHIRNLQGTDSGKYSCRVENEKNNFDFIHLFVKEDVPKKSDLRSDGSQNGKDIQLQKSEREIVVNPGQIIGFKASVRSVNASVDDKSQWNPVLDFTQRPEYVDHLGIRPTIEMPDLWFETTKSLKAIDEDNETIYTGDDVVLNCRVIEEKNLSVRWFHNDVELTNNVKKLFNEHSVILRAKLENVTIQDSGEYICLTEVKRIGIIHQFNQSTTIEVHGVSPPLMIGEKQESIRVKSGEVLMLKCSITGIPQPTITWWKDAFQINDGISDNGSLIIKKTNVQDGGTYKCIGRNRAGEESQTMHLWIDEDRPEPIILIPFILLFVVAFFSLVIFAYFCLKYRKRISALQRALLAVYDELMGETPDKVPEMIDTKPTLVQQTDKTGYDELLTTLTTSDSPNEYENEDQLSTRSLSLS